MSALLSIIGKKGSGKSEILEKLIALLSQRGFRIGVIKHLGRDDIEIDEPGKDTYRYRSQGAETVVLAGRRRLALFSNLGEEIPLEGLLNFFRDFDLVFLEGYFQDEFPKIEVHRKELGDFLLTEKVKNRFAICSDRKTLMDIPCFDFSQMDELAEFIVQKSLRGGMLNEAEAISEIASSATRPPRND